MHARPTTQVPFARRTTPTTNTTGASRRWRSCLQWPLGDSIDAGTLITPLQHDIRKCREAVAPGHAARAGGYVEWDDRLSHAATTSPVLPHPLSPMNAANTCSNDPEVSANAAHSVTLDRSRAHVANELREAAAGYDA